MASEAAAVIELAPAAAVAAAELWLGPDPGVA